MINDKTRRSANVLYSGADAGLYTLPADLVDARVNVDRLNATPPTPVMIRYDQLMGQAAAAAAAGGDVDTTAIEAHRTAIADYELRSQVHGFALEIADTTLGNVLRRCGDTVITEHLQPAHAAIVTEAAKVFAKLAGIPETATTETTLAFDKPIREAWLRADVLAEHWATIHSARAAVVQLSGRVSEDTYGYFHEISNADTVKPWILSRGRHYVDQTEHETVPDTARARLRWYLEHNATMWLPTTDQQDEAEERVFGARRRETRAVFG